MHNIFQGNELILKSIAKVWNYPFQNKEDLRGSMTRDMFFQAFFYLTQRFGKHKKQDEYKDAGLWTFQVEEFKIQILLNTSWVIVMMFGEGKYINISRMSPYNVKRDRVIHRLGAKFINIWSDKKSEEEEKVLSEQWEIFCIENNIDDSWTQEKFDKEKSTEWINYIEKYNDNLIGVDYKSFVEKYGYTYENAETKRAIFILEKFLKNMLIPVSIRDANFNIKGLCGDEFRNMSSGLNIEFIR